MLVGLLPGLREIRAPLATGYLWLLAAWLVLHDRLPTEAEATGTIAALYDLRDLASGIGLGVALSFAAYLVGVLSESLLKNPLTKMYYRVSSWRPTYLRLRYGFGGFSASFSAAAPRIPGYPIGRDQTEREVQYPWFPAVSFRAQRAIVLLVERAVRDVAARIEGQRISLAEVLAPEVELDNDEDYEKLLKKYSSTDNRKFRRLEGQWLYGTGLPALMFRVVRELDLVETQLVGKEPDLFAASHRLREEAEFRRDIVPPLLALSAIVAIQARWLWFAPLLVGGAIFASLLLRESYASAKKRFDLLTDAARLKRADVPILAQLGAAAEQRITREREREATGEPPTGAGRRSIGSEAVAAPPTSTN